MAAIGPVPALDAPEWVAQPNGMKTWDVTVGTGTPVPAGASALRDVPSVDAAGRLHYSVVHGTQERSLQLAGLADAEGEPRITGPRARRRRQPGARDPIQ